MTSTLAHHGRTAASPTSARQLAEDLRVKIDGSRPSKAMMARARLKDADTRHSREKTYWWPDRYTLQSAGEIARQTRLAGSFPCPIDRSQSYRRSSGDFPYLL